MKPTIGRIVFYFPTPGEPFGVAPCAAVITRVWKDSVVNLTVFRDGMTSVTPRMNIAQGSTPGCWDWPVREDAAPEVANTDDKA